MDKFTDKIIAGKFIDKIIAGKFINGGDRQVSSEEQNSSVRERREGGAIRAANWKMAKLSLFLSVLALFTLGNFSCKGRDATRYSLISTRLYSQAEGKERSKAYVRRGEKLLLLQGGQERSLIRLSDQQEGYIQNRWLAYKIVVIPDAANHKIYSRPTVTSRPHGNSAFLRPAVAFFVLEKAKNDEGEWYKISSRFRALDGSPKGLNGWLKKDESLIEELSTVQDALALDIAIAKIAPKIKNKDFSDLDRLMQRPGAVGRAAAMADEQLRLPASSALAEENNPSVEAGQEAGSAGSSSATGSSEAKQ